MWRGRSKSYLLEFNHSMSVHTLDIPLSVWQAGIDPANPFFQTDAISFDVQRLIPGYDPLIFIVVPFDNPAAIAPPTVADSKFFVPLKVLKSLRALAARLGAPAIILEAFDLVTSGRPFEDVVGLLEETAPAPNLLPAGISSPADPPPPADDAPADRAAKMRQAKAEKAAARAAVQDPPAPDGIDPLM